MKGVVPSNGHHLTLADVKKHAVVSEDVHACPTRVISLENTLAGEVMPLQDCREISTWARDRGIIMHLDGARLWEAVAAQVARREHNGDLAAGLKAYCACFDSVSLCFSKGLGAPIGSVIVGSEKFIGRARHVRKSIGGGLRQAGVITAAARVAVDETFLGGKLVGSHERARQIAEMWTSKGGKLTQGCETNMVWFDLAAAGVDVKKFVEVGVAHGLQFLGGRLVVHYRRCCRYLRGEVEVSANDSLIEISDEAVSRLKNVMDEILGAGKLGIGTTEEKEVAEKAMEPEME